MLPEDGTGTQERDRVEKERAKLLVVLVTLCHADGRWNRLQKRVR